MGGNVFYFWGQHETNFFHVCQLLFIKNKGSPLFKSLGTVFFFFFLWKKLILLFSKNTLNSLSDSRDIYNVANNCCSIHQRIMKKICFSQKYRAAQLFSMWIIIRNVSWAANQYNRMISEGSCDTEVMAAENSALHHRNKLYFQIY